MGQKFNHGEAFNIMEYKSADGNLVERLWNSRDGVTPFTIPMRGVDGYTLDSGLTHSDFGKDIRAQAYEPPKGTRIFIDYSKEEYIESLLRGRIGQLWDAHGDQMRASLEVDNVEAAAAKVAESEWQVGTPRLVTVGIDGDLIDLLEMGRIARNG